LAVAKSLTPNIIAKRTPLIIERDYPDDEEFTCCYCEQRFIENHHLWKKTWEHLDNDRTNEELWNLAWAHWHCNQKKKNDFDLELIAREIIQKNQEWESQFDFESLSVSVGEKGTPRQIHKDTLELKEGDINLIANKLAKSQLEENLPPGCKDQISYRQTLRDIHFLLIKETDGRGSEQATRRALDVLTQSKFSEWEEKKLGKGNRVIQRRNERVEPLY